MIRFKFRGRYGLDKIDLTRGIEQSLEANNKIHREYLAEFIADLAEQVAILHAQVAPLRKDSPP